MGFMKRSKKITIGECIEAMNALKDGKTIPQHIKLDNSQKSFLWCVVNKY